MHARTPMYTRARTYVRMLARSHARSHARTHARTLAVVPWQFPGISQNPIDSWKAHKQAKQKTKT